MYVEDLVIVITQEAKDQIDFLMEESYKSGRGLTWSQTDAIGQVRGDLRVALRALSTYKDDLGVDDALEFIFKEVEYNNVVLEQILRDRA